jgi:short-subunit dehydrogenase
MSSPVPALPAPPVVLVTGASSGIGRATAVLFARRGWRVGLIARGTEGLEATRAEIAAAGGVAAVQIADVTDAAALNRAAEALQARLGPVSVWINAAGNGVYGRVGEVPEAEFRQVTEVTYHGTVNGTRIALAAMRGRGSGAVVNLCSGVALYGLPLMASYAGAKAAVRAFTQSVHVELRLARSRVRIGTVIPPAANTPFFCHAPSHMGFPARPVPPVYQPEVIARAVYLCATGKRTEWLATSTILGFALICRISTRLAAFLMTRLGYDGQLTRDPDALALAEPNLFAPARRLTDTRGPFGARARGWSAQVALAEFVQLRLGIGRNRDLAVPDARTRRTCTPALLPVATPEG